MSNDKPLSAAEQAYSIAMSTAAKTFATAYVAAAAKDAYVAAYDAYIAAYVAAYDAYIAAYVADAAKTSMSPLSRPQPPLESCRRRRHEGENRVTANTLADAILLAVTKYGSYREAGKALGIDHAYLHKLVIGRKNTPSDALLRKLGLCRTVTITYSSLHQPTAPVSDVLGELIEAAEEVRRITDRTHDAWRRLEYALTAARAMKEPQP